MNEQRPASYRHRLVSANPAEFGGTAEALNWISPAGAMAAQTERGKRLQSMGQRLHLAFKGTKPHIGPLSPGCRICGEGDWSCLFVNGKCNCRCFYCPSSQAEIGVPTTNRDQLDKRKYTYLHGEKVTVLESELTALALMQHAVDRNIGLPVNYCASVFQHRFQRAAARRKSARLMVKPHESITECGYIRSLCLVGDPEKVVRQKDQLTSQGVDHQLWSIGSRNDRLYFHPQLWEHVAPDALNPVVIYSEALLCPQISYHRTFKEVRVNSEKRLFIEKQPVCSEIHLDAAQRTRFISIVNHRDSAVLQNHDSSDDRFLGYELIQPGLQDYF